MAPIQTEQAATHDIVSEGVLTTVAFSIAREGSLGDISLPEASLVDSVSGTEHRSVPSAGVIQAIRAGHDPLGDALLRLRPQSQRRELGAVYTPMSLVSPVVAWVGEQAVPAQVVDPGCGSARLLIAAGRAFTESALVGVEVDPLAALVARANLTAAGQDSRAELLVQDYRSAQLPFTEGISAFVGNPPYVRHHLIEPEWKAWLCRKASALGLRPHARGGLHVYFLLATALHANKGDIGCFILPSEWRDTGYGDFVEEILMEALGAVSVHSIDPRCAVFGGTHTTSMMACFRKGERPQGLLVGEAGSAAELQSLDWGRMVDRGSSPLRPKRLTCRNGQRPLDSVELGEVCRVRRGAVTGANGVWVTDACDGRLPQEYLLPCVTKAKELFNAVNARLVVADALRRLVALPINLDHIDANTRALIDEFLREAEALGAHGGFVACHRNAWWSVEIPEPAPILATYMARRPPAFVRNLVGARHLNVALGLYPLHPMTPDNLDLLAATLGRSVTLGEGRSYAGGLTKFEPSDLSRVLLPPEAADALLTQPRLPMTSP